MIRLTLKLFFCSGLASGMPTGAYIVFFVFVCAGNRFKHVNPIISNEYKISEMNLTVLVIFAI